MLETTRSLFMEYTKQLKYGSQTRKIVPYLSAWGHIESEKFIGKNIFELLRIFRAFY